MSAHLVESWLFCQTKHRRPKPQLHRVDPATNFDAKRREAYNHSPGKALSAQQCQMGGVHAGTDA